MEQKTVLIGLKIFTRLSGENLVLTAAHCFRDFEEDRLPFVKLVFGAHKFNGEFVEGTEQVTHGTADIRLLKSLRDKKMSRKRFIQV